jgi:hypothetical protein
VGAGRTLAPETAADEIAATVSHMLASPHYRDAAAAQARDIAACVDGGLAVSAVEELLAG